MIKQYNLIEEKLTSTLTIYYINKNEMGNLIYTTWYYRLEIFNTTFEGYINVYSDEDLIIKIINKIKEDFIKIFNIKL